jgi:uncharacterized protein YdiU (UPF0061 family)
VPTPPAFDRRFVTELPGDPRTDTMPRQVAGAAWSRVQPTRTAAPRLLAWSRPLAAELGLGDDLMQAAPTAAVLGGNELWPGMDPYAANYGGHQFGHWAGQLGDGRAIVLGELRRPDGSRVELQLKGAGPTAYSRRGDGRAVLRSSLREFVCSEAMHALGVPTTRALSLVATGDDVVRDMFYDGNAQAEPGAITCRVAPSFVRFGSFELPSSRGDDALLRTLTDFVLRHHFADLGPPGRAAHEALLREVARRTAELIAHWQAIGFVHGVMNTDNMSPLGLTIDYGPYGWIDDFDLGWTPNTTDAGQRRYRFGNQPSIGLWNVERLGIALLPLFAGEERPVLEALDLYRQTYAATAQRRFARKLGFTTELAGDGELLDDLFGWLGAFPTDMTRCFRALSSLVLGDEPGPDVPAAIAAVCYGEPGAEHRTRIVAWLRRWWQRVRREADAPAAIAARMDTENPWFVPRNWIAQEVIDAAHQGDLAPLHRLLDVLQRPFTEQPTHAAWAAQRPEWAKAKPGCSALSCSS